MLASASDSSVYDPSGVRRSNDVGASAVADDPTRFGLLAAPPLEDVDAAVEEIERVTREHRPDGFALCATYGGEFLGAERFRPVWRELDRRGATVLVHPNPFTPGVLPLPPPLFEVAFDTARTAVSLLWSRTLQDHQAVRVIFTHGGGVLPALAGRLHLLCEADWVPHEGVTAEDVSQALRRVYYDTAMSGSASSLAPILTVTTLEHLVYGSDFGAPCANMAALQHNLRDLMSGVAWLIGLFVMGVPDIPELVRDQVNAVITEAVRQARSRRA
ncbi:amidohydrolase family protein [Rhodococcus sp. P1Y]|uniref:amidohydrolase family protein n=1 Tax=Rhodococcus sp. P1Y TaxID=1302308 RepID=UPI00268C5C9C